MAVILTQEGTFGPFDRVEELEDRVRCYRGAEVVDLLYATIGDYTISDDARLAPMPPRWPSLEVGKAEIIAAADRMAKAKRDTVTADNSPAEMVAWPIKRAEALAWQQSGNAADAPSLNLEARVRGVTLAVLVGKVLANAAQLSALEAGIAGRCGAIRDAASAAKTQADLEVIEVDAGWPV